MRRIFSIYLILPASLWFWGRLSLLTKMSARKLPGDKLPARRADNLAPSMSRMSENVGASTCRNPKDLHGLYRDNLTLPFLVFKIFCTSIEN
jgi:hypothetical protein